LIERAEPELCPYLTGKLGYKDRIRNAGRKAASLFANKNDERKYGVAAIFLSTPATAKIPVQIEQLRIFQTICKKILAKKSGDIIMAIS